MSVFGYLKKAIRKKAKSFMELREEKIERFKRLSEAVIGEPSKKLAFENMHFMEDKQWVKISDVEACFGAVEQQLKDLLKNKPKRKAYTMNSYLDDEIDEFLEKLEKLLGDAK